MTSERDRDLLEGVRAGTAAGVVVADDPASVASELAQDQQTVIVGVADLGAAVAGARVTLAEVVVDRTRGHEQGVPVDHAPAATPDDGDGLGEDHATADRQAVRFALVILLLALPGGIAVYLADGLVLAPALPALALVGLGVVVLTHRGGTDAPSSSPTEAVATPPSPAGDALAVRVAEAHLRRAQAAWKLHWWERDLPVPALDEWSVRLPAGVPLTLVAVDPEGEVPEGTLATMTATAPAAVRVVVLQAG